MQQETSFWGELIHQYWEKHKPPAEPENYPNDIRVAIEMLLTCSGKTQGQLADWIGMRNHSTLRAALSRGGPFTPEMCRTMEAMAKEYQLPVLAEWFGMEAYRRTKTRAVRSRGGVGAGRGV